HPRGTAWSRCGLSEVLPEPTPMTWAIVQHLVSGLGGLGLMYRDLGFGPDRSLDTRGAYDLICGRTFCNLRREPLFYAGRLPLEHSMTELKKDPHLAGNPRPRLDFLQAGWRFWAGLPFYFFRSIRQSAQLQRTRRTFAQPLQD